jgi:uracil-DNA glycosylase
MIKEAGTNQKIRKSGGGNLERWAKQGVLLLNTTLTVRKGAANSHQRESGWSVFTDHVVRTISEKKKGGVVFMLWGLHAQSKGGLVDRKRHCVLETSHPSGLSAYRGFIGSRCFSKTNEYLRERGEKGIDWSV